MFSASSASHFNISCPFLVASFVLPRKTRKDTKKKNATRCRRRTGFDALRFCVFSCSSWLTFFRQPFRFVADDGFLTIAINVLRVISVAFQHFLPLSCRFVCVATKNTKRHKEEKRHALSAPERALMPFVFVSFRALRGYTFFRQPFRFVADDGFLTIANNVLRVISVAFQHFLPLSCRFICVATKNTKRHEEEKRHALSARRTGFDALRFCVFSCSSWLSFFRQPFRFLAHSQRELIFAGGFLVVVR